MSLERAGALHRPEQGTRTFKVAVSPLVPSSYNPDLAKYPTQLRARVSHAQQLRDHPYFLDSNGTGFEAFTYGNLRSTKEVVRFFADLGDKDLIALRAFTRDEDIQSIADPLLKNGISYQAALRETGQSPLYRHILLFEDRSIGNIRRGLEFSMSTKAKQMRDSRHDKVGDATQRYRVTNTEGGRREAVITLPNKDEDYGIKPERLAEISNTLSIREQRGFRHMQALLNGVLTGFLTRQSLEMFRFDPTGMVL